MTADAGSRSHSPVPIPVASAIDTAMKIDLSNSTSESDNLLGSTIPWTGPGFWTGLDSGLDLWIMAQFSIL